MDTCPKQTRGYTLIELLAVLAVIGIAAAVGAPPLTDWLASQRLSAEMQMLMRDMQHARHQAVKTNRPVVVCASADQQTCDRGGDWRRGWISFFNDDNDQPARRDSGELLLGAHRLSPRVSVAANRNAFHFRGDLRRATNGTLVACDRSSAAKPRVLIVSYTGRPRLVPPAQQVSAPPCV